MGSTFRRLVDAVSKMRYYTSGVDFLLETHRASLQRERLLQKFYTCISESVSSFEDVSGQHGGGSLDSCVSVDFIEASWMFWKRHFSTDLCADLPTASSIRKTNTVLDSTVWKIVLAKDLDLKRLHFRTPLLWQHDHIEPLRPAIVQNRWTLRVWDHIRIEISCCNVSLRVESNVFMIVDCSVLVHLSGYVSTMVTTLVYLRTRRSTSTRLICFSCWIMA